MKTNKNIFFSALCLCLMLILSLSLIACDGDTQSPVDTPTEATPIEDGKAAVVRTTVPMLAGDKITADKVKIDYVTEENIPLNAIRDIDSVIGKYLKADLVAGDYIFQSKITSNLAEDVEKIDVAYVSVKPYIKDYNDCADIIQKLISLYPGRTLYFADGTYTISKPLVISAHPDEKVSFELSDFAVIKASDSWSSNSAMIRIGAENADLFHDEIGPSDIGITGGMIDGNGKAMGIAVEGGRDSAITNVTVKNTTVGITLGDYAGYKAKTVVENTNIVGCGDSSVGIAIISDGNNLDIVQIDNCGTGVKLEGNHNTLRNVHATYAGSSKNSRGFEDNSQVNNYDFCYAENFSTGFYMGETVVGSQYSTCYVFWNNKIAKQTAFEAAGKFNSNLRTCRADFIDADAETSLLSVSITGGSGKLLWAIVKNINNIDDKTYTSYLGGTEITETIE